MKWRSLSKSLWTTLLLCRDLSDSIINQPLNRVKSFPYLYSVEGNPNASSPVIEHLAWIHRPDYDVYAEVPENDRPDFLFSDTGTYRIVEFYVHWCDICKNFKPHYIELGRRVRQLVGETVTVDVHAVSCAPNRPLCRELAIDSYPYFRVFVPGDAEGVDVPHAQVNPATILHKMAITVDEQALAAVGDDENWNADVSTSHPNETTLSWWSHLVQPWSRSQPSPGKYGHKRSRDELRDDVHVSFDYAMRHGVFVSNDPLSPERALVLFEWLLLLRTTLPISWTRMHRVVQGLIDNFDYVKRSEDYMLTILDEFPPLSGVDAAVWSVACSHGEADAGYACGLWQLFHVVTIGVVDYNRAVAFRDHCLRTEVVARTLRDYIEAFFGCEVCRRNFVASFDACSLQRCTRLLWNETGDESDWIQLPLWLFETHNAVNLRLQAEHATREKRSAPTETDQHLVLWPPVVDCPSCWDSGGDQSRPWNNSAVYRYLKVEYGQRDAASVEFKLELAMFEGNAAETTSRPFNDVRNWIQSFFLPPDSASKLSGWMWFTFFFSALNDDSAPRRTATEISRDVHFVLDCMMRNGVHRGSGLIDPARRAVFKEWLLLLDATLPGAWKTLHSMIRDLLDNLSFAMASKDYMVAVLDDYIDNIPDRKICSIVDSGANELWDVFYAIAVGANRFNQDVLPSQRLTIVSVVGIVRNAFVYFLDCEVCHTALEELFASCAFDVCRDDSISRKRGDWSNLALWLVATHNTVLNRLSSSISHVQSDVDILVKGDVYWPSNKTCTDCWTLDGKNDRNSTFKFLQDEYGAYGMTGADDLKEL